MRIAELSQASGVPVATIKYYLRAGLLPPGERTAVNQARYDEAHVRRLRLIRVLRDVAELPVASIGEILAAVDDDTRSLHEVLGVAHAALGPPIPERGDGELTVARREVDAYLDRLGWRVAAHAPARGALAHTLVRLRELGLRVSPDDFDVYADVADSVAAWELDRLDADTDRESQVEQAVVGTVVYEAVFTALRRLAQEHHSAQRFGQ